MRSRKGDCPYCLDRVKTLYVRIYSEGVPRWAARSKWAWCATCERPVLVIKTICDQARDLRDLGV